MTLTVNYDYNDYDDDDYCDYNDEYETSHHRLLQEQKKIEQERKERENFQVTI